MTPPIKPISAIAESQVQILEHHLDTFLHVNHTIYLQLFEKARWDFLTKGGYGLDEVHRHGAGPIILSAEVKFRKEVKNREICSIQTQCSDYRRMMFKIDQKMINVRGEIASQALYTCALFDLKARKIIQPTERFLRAIGLWDGPASQEYPRGSDAVLSGAV